uniref:SR-related CTD associated factor 4 n=1 Tax=Amazona collaria TaxID=241587 RepID=A0A8B9EV36_9PSIT
TFLLFSLMEMKPPISRAKMILITKAAIKAIKLYKHVVQIVEKFIKKCKPEYKVPGLYVIDSIVRQSRHQFGTDKDVFGPRFSKNITATFQYLYLCPSEDKSKIVRVLNLWQKNGVFKIEIIQPLLDMAAGTSATAPMTENATNNEGSPPPPAKVASEPPQVTANSVPTVPQLPSSDAFAAVAQLFQTTQGQQLQQILQTFQQPQKPQSPVIDNTVMAQVQAITAQLKTTAAQQPEQKAAFPPPEQKTSFDKKLLDRFDYDDEPEAVEDSKKEDSAPSSVSQPALTSLSFSAQAGWCSIPGGFPAEGMQQPVFPQLPNMDPFQQRMMGIQQDPMRHQVPLPPNGQMPGFGLLPTPQYPPMAQPVIPPAAPAQQSFQSPFPVQSESHMQKPHQQDMEVEQPPTQEGKRHVSDSRKSRSRSASRSPKRRRSRSGSRSRRSRHRRSRSRSRDRRRHSPKSRSQERRERERERERRSKGLPQIKSETVSVCSTTLWVGQLDKRTTQQDVGSLLEEFGPIESINMIPPRGCAYIVMVHRQDAYRALQKLSRGNFKVNQKSIKVLLGKCQAVLNCTWAQAKPQDTFTEMHLAVCITVTERLVIPVSSVASKIPGFPNICLPINTRSPQEHFCYFVPPHPSGPPVVGALQPPAFTAPLGIPPPGFAPGVPPPPPPPFLRPGFNPMHLPPGFLPPGPPPPITPPVSVPHTPAVNIPNSTATGVNEDTTKDSSIGNPIPTVVSGSRGTAETTESSKIYGTVPPPTNAPAPVTQAIPHLGTQGVAPPPPAPVVGLQTPSTGLLGARPGLIPLQRPPGMPPPPLQRFPLMPPRHMPHHMMHRGPPPGPGGFGMPPPHGMKTPFPPPGHFVRPGGMPGSGAPGGPEENRDGRQYRNDRQTFTPNRDQERFGRRSYGNRAENDRDRYSNRNDERDHERLGSRDRREWGRRSPERDRHRDLEDRNRRSGGHRDRERDSRDRESRRDKEETRGKEKQEMTDRADSDKNHESHGSKMGDADIVSKLTSGDSEPTGVKPAEELTPAATSSLEQAEKDLGSVSEAPR